MTVSTNSTRQLRPLPVCSLLLGISFAMAAIVGTPANAIAQDEQAQDERAQDEQAQDEQAQDKQTTTEPATGTPTPRFSQTFEPAGTNQKVRLQVEPTVSREEWEVHVVTGKNLEKSDQVKTLLREKLPSWVVADHYGFALITKTLGDGVSAVLLAALPGIHSDGPPSATQLQVVWIVENQRGKLNWRRLDTAQYSTLDGGERFEFQQDGKTHQLVRRRRGDDSLFCGDSAADPILFDRYNPKKESFEQTLDIAHLVEDAPVLSATRADKSFTPPTLEAWYQWFGASSDRRSPDRRGALIRPLELGDGQSNTGWMEGAEELGRGEFVSAQINDAVALRSIRIVPGIGGDKRLFNAFARPTRLLIGLSGGTHYVVDLGDIDYEQVNSGEGVIVELPEPEKTSCLSVMLLDAKRGKAVRGQPAWTRDTTAIAEITPYSVLHADDAPKTAKRIVEAISDEEDPRRRQRISELSLSVENHLADEVRRAVRQGNAEKRRRIIPLMSSLPADEAIPMLIQIFRDTPPTAPEYRAVKRSLAAHYTKAAPELVKFLNDETVEGQKHIDVLRLLGRVGEPSHLIGLIDSLGKGETAVRNERVRAVGAGGRALIEPLLIHARDNANTDAGYDALRALNLLGKRLHFNGQGELPRPELLAELLDATDNRRSLMRAFEVAKYFHAPGFVEATRDKHSAHDDILVRRAAIEALERYPSELARQVLVDALEDTSPDVRIAAVSALGQRGDASKAVDDVLEYSQNERWKAGLMQAFRMLADVDNQTTTDAFEARFREKPNAEASLWAARALDRAGRSVRAELAQSLIENQEVDLELRLEMLDLLGLDSSERGENFLMGILTDERWTELAEATRARHQIRDHVMLSLGRRRSQKAMPKLLDIAQAANDTDVRQVALRSLAFYQDESLLAELRLWRETANPDLQGILDQTITMIDRRRTLSSLKSNIDEVIENREESETNEGDDASNSTSAEER